MKDWLIKHFIPNSDNTNNAEIRLKYGYLATSVGISANLILFSIKLISAILTHSLAIIGDAFNNLSDCLSCILALLGLKLAAKPADREHPFGHGRYEYLISFISIIFIILVDYELFKESLNALFNPVEANFNIFSIISLLFSILIKLFLASFYKTISIKTNNLAYEASGKDSLNDCLTTAVALISFLLQFISENIPYDGIGGLLVAIIIFINILGLAREIIDSLIGQSGDDKIYRAIGDIISKDKDILGYHDLIIHDYGTVKKMATVDIEIDSQKTFKQAHEIADRIEREINNELNIQLLAHMDPVDCHDHARKKYNKYLIAILKDIDKSLSLHDLQIKKEDNKVILSFDILIPYECNIKNETIKKIIEERMESDHKNIKCIIDFDHPFNS